MEFKKSSSSYEIIDSGSLFNFSKDDSLLIKCIFDEFSFDIELSFSMNTEKEREIQCSIEENTVKIKCVNFNNPLGTGTTTPIELAKYQGKKICLHFWVYTLGNGVTRKVDYCLYKEM